MKHVLLALSVFFFAQFAQAYFTEAEIPAGDGQPLTEKTIVECVDTGEADYWEAGYGRKFCIAVMLPGGEGYVVDTGEGFYLD